MLPYRPKSRRAALSVTAAALLAASPILTACGSTPHPGAAAVVDGKRITVSQLQAEVEDIREAQRKSPQSSQLIANTARLNRVTLNGMIFDRVLDRAARDAGVTVTRTEIQKTRVELERGAGGAARLRQVLLQQYAISPGQVETTVRNQVSMEKLAQALGVDRKSPQGQQKIIAALSRASKEMGIDVNPRFGTWNNKKVLLDNVKEPWLRAAPAGDEQT
jgi:hypothetical protein